MFRTVVLCHARCEWGCDKYNFWKALLQISQSGQDSYCRRNSYQHISMIIWGLSQHSRICENKRGISRITQGRFISGITCIYLPIKQSTYNVFNNTVWLGICLLVKGLSYKDWRVLTELSSMVQRSECLGGHQSVYICQFKWEKGISWTFVTTLKFGEREISCEELWFVTQTKLRAAACDIKYTQDSALWRGGCIYVIWYEKSAEWVHHVQTTFQWH